MRHIKGNHSAVDASYGFPPQPDRSLFPLFYRARPHLFEIRAGDCLVMPPCWWHWVFSDGESIAVNCWFDWQAAPEPTVQRGACGHWEATRRWTLDYLNRNFTEDTYVSATLSRKPNLGPVKRPHPAYAEKVYVYKTDRFSKFYQNVVHFVDCYHQAVFTLNRDFGIVRDLSLAGILSGGLEKEFGTDALTTSPQLPPYVLDNTNLWVNVNDGQSGLHFDAYSNVLFQIRGRKRVLMFSPDDEENLYRQDMPVESGDADELRELVL